MGGYDNQIQELNYKITVALNSDARSEVEGLRWIITRRAVTALVIVAIAILATLRFSTYMTHVQEQERLNMMKKPTVAAAKKEEQEDNKATNGDSERDSARGNDAARMWAESPTAKALGEKGAGDGVMVCEGGVSLG